MSNESQNLPREMILRAYKAPLYLSRNLYKFTPFYAKQTQFAKKSNVYKPIYDKQLQ